MGNKYISAARPLHWCKNLIVFVPVLMAHQFHLLTESINGLLIFFSFSFFASTGYLINDFCDREDDQLNYYKKSRAYARGELTRKQLFILAGFFLLSGMLFSFALSSQITSLLLIYLLISILYSCVLKKYFILDVLLITLFFLFRIFVGNQVYDVAYSSWLFAFAFFFFFGLGSIKRVAELQNAKDGVDGRVSQRRAYLPSDMPVMMMFGIASSFISILILALYIQSSAALKYYSHVELLWLLCPVLLYWLYRLWLLSYRGVINKDPMAFVLLDPISYICLVLLGVTLFGAI